MISFVIRLSKCSDQEIFVVLICDLFKFKMCFDEQRVLDNKEYRCIRMVSELVDNRYRGYDVVIGSVFCVWPGRCPIHSGYAPPPSPPQEESFEIRFRRFAASQPLGPLLSLARPPPYRNRQQCPDMPIPLPMPPQPVYGVQHQHIIVPGYGYGQPPPNNEGEEREIDESNGGEEERFNDPNAENSTIPGRESDPDFLDEIEFVPNNNSNS